MTFKNLKKLDLNLLLVLDAMMQEGQVSKAAERIGLTQSAASHALNRLRMHFDDPLFTRDGRTMVATSFAEQLRPEIQDILHQIDSLGTRSTDFDPATSDQTFVIGLPEYMAVALLSDLNKVLGAQAPYIKIITVNVNAVTGPMLLEKGEVDIVVGRFDTIPKALSSEVLFEEDYVCVTRADHPLSNKTRLGLHDYTKAAHMHVSLSGQDQGLVDHYIRNMGYARNVQMTVSNYMLALLMIEDNDLILSEPRHTVMPLVDKLNLCVYEFPFSGLSFEVSQLWHRKQESNAAHQWLREQIKQIAQRHSQMTRPIGN